VGRYTVNGQDVKVELWLYRSGQEIAAEEIRGSTADLDALAAEIATAIETGLPAE